MTLKTLGGFVILLIIFASGCRKDKAGPFFPASVDFKINITHSVDGAAVELDTIRYTNAAGNLYSVVNLRYFISKIKLYKGSEAQDVKTTHYVDLRYDNTFSFSSQEKITNGSYDSLTFLIGLDTVINKKGYFVNPPEVNMEWPVPLGGGYHYMQMEGKYDSAGVTNLNYNTHTGATNGVPYFIKVNLPLSSFMVNGKNVTATIDMNINNWYNDPNVYDFFTYGDAIMGNPTAQQVLMQNGYNVFSLKSIQ